MKEKACSHDTKKLTQNLNFVGVLARERVKFFNALWQFFSKSQDCHAHDIRDIELLQKLKKKSSRWNDSS